MARDNKHWTEQEDEILRTEYPKGDTEALAVRLDRRVTTVVERARHLHVYLSAEALKAAQQRRITSMQRGSRHVRFKGCGRVTGAYYGRLRNKRRQLPINVTVEYLDSIAVDICPLSGRQLTYLRFARDRDSTASLDRIDSSRGYIEGNVRWIHKDVNILRSNMTDEQLFLWARDVADYYGKIPRRLGTPSVGRIYRSHVASLRSGARERGLSFPLLDGSIENQQYLNEIVTDVCPLSGRPLTFRAFSSDRSSTASLDRIDSSQGYEKGNVRWIHKVVNRMKSDGSDEWFVALMRDIANTMSKGET